MSTLEAMGLPRYRLHPRQHALWARYPLDSPSTGRATAATSIASAPGCLRGFPPFLTRLGRPVPFNRVLKKIRAGSFRGVHPERVHREGSVVHADPRNLLFFHTKQEQADSSLQRERSE